MAGFFLEQPSARPRHWFDFFFIEYFKNEFLLFNNMNFKNKIILGPMVPINNIGFRRLCTDYGADIVYSQMIDSWAFDRGNTKLADFYDEKNVIGQFFGNNAEIISRCVKAVEEKVQAVDLNLGCPHSDVVKRKCGSYLMKFPDIIRKVVGAMVKSVNVPVTVKIRAGYDRQHQNAVDIAKICEEEGVSAIAVHGRARTVNYEKPVDYEIIKKVKEAVSVPVIGNGDIFLGRDAKRMFDETGCDGIMIARAAMKNPFVFTQVKEYLNIGITLPDMNYNEKIDLALEHSRMAVEYYGDELGCKTMRKHLAWYTKGMPGGGDLRRRLMQVKSLTDIETVLNSLSFS